jgi:serine phosphatase RsbU (regulator of sigma subunit)
VRLRKSTRVWIAALVVAVGLSYVFERSASVSGCWTLLAKLAAVQAACILLWRAGAVLVRLIVRRLTLRLAFSYFLIGLVPIPLLAALLGLASYIVAHQFMANRLRREATEVGEEGARAGSGGFALTVGPDGRVTASDLPWLAKGSAAAWALRLARPGFLVHGDEVWLATPAGADGRLAVLSLSDPKAPWLQVLADRTGYETSVDVGTAKSQGTNFKVDTAADKPHAGITVASKPAEGGGESVHRRPRDAAPPGAGLWRKEWVHAFYLENALNAPSEGGDDNRRVAVLMAVTSPDVIVHQFFTQGVAEISGVFRVAFLVLAGIVLAVYVAALAVAFVLVGSIARNVNRLTRATEAVARGDFSVRVHSKSRDQIGDLARSFDGMAASIQGLLAETAQKERLESEIAIARTIQQKLLPPPEGRVDGVSILAHFAPVAEIGGDYYDHLRMPDGRVAFTLGDVSGHGLPTGLLVAMAKAGLSSLVEAGHDDGELFARLNELIHRSTDPRHYMTLAFLAVDPKTREAVLTNAGQLAPYRISAAGIEPLALPSFPLGLFPARTFPSRRERFAAGDRLVFYSDGFIEGTDAADEPFGFERFEAVLRTHAASPAPELRDALLAAVAAHTGDRPAEDDRTLLILTFEEEPPLG